MKTYEEYKSENFELGDNHYRNRMINVRLVGPRERNISKRESSKNIKEI